MTNPRKEACFAIIDDLIDRDVNVLKLGTELPRLEYNALRKRLTRTFGGINQALIEYGFYDTNGTPSSTELARCFEINELYEVVAIESRKAELIDLYYLSEIEFRRLSADTISALRLDAIDEFHREMFPFDGLTFSVLQRDYRQLLTYITFAYGTLKRFLDAYNTPFDIFVSRDFGSDKIRAGHVFERKLGEILRAIHGRSAIKTHHFESGCRPDFTVNGRWVDAKLSYGALFDSRCRTIEKYTAVTDSLTVYYAIDRKETKVIRGVTVSHVSALYPLLDGIGRSGLAADMDAFIKNFSAKVCEIPHAVH